MHHREWAHSTGGEGRRMGRAAVRRTPHSHSAPPMSARLCITAVRIAGALAGRGSTHCGHAPPLSSGRCNVDSMKIPPPRGTSNSERTQTVKGGKGEAAIRRTLHSHSAPPVSARLCIAAVRRSDRAIQVSPIAPLSQSQLPVPGGGRSILPLTFSFRSWLCSSTNDFMGCYTRFNSRSARGTTQAIVGGGSGSRRGAVGA